MQTTLPASIGASNRTSARGQERPVKFGVPNGCSAISRTNIPSGSSSSPSMLTKATPSGLAIRPRRISMSLLTGSGDRHIRAPRQRRHRYHLQFCPRMQTWGMAMDTAVPGRIRPSARWIITVVSLIATASSFLFINGVAFLIPSLQTARGIPLDEAGLLSSMPSWGMVVTLVLWGYVLDRVGERIVMTLGSGLTAAAAYAAASAHSMVSTAVYLFLGGMAAASCNTAGGRLVSAWFPPNQRGLAMGVRQTAQPLGIALGALVIPELAERGPGAGLRFTAMACAVAAVASVVGIRNPPRKPRETDSEQELASPYRGSLALWRIPAGAGLLMMPQTITVTFMLVWLIKNLHWSVAAAGGLVTLSQLLGALGRIMVGRWSDRIGSRMVPVRIIAFLAAVTLFLLAWADQVNSRYQ